MRKRTKILIVAGLVLAISAIGVKVLLDSFQGNLDELSETPIANLSLAHAIDGTFEGSYNAFPVTAKVKVTIRDHRISRIEIIEHNNGQGQAAESLPADVISAQSLDVDTVTGATYSSVVILKAIESALLSAGAAPID